MPKSRKQKRKSGKQKVYKMIGCNKKNKSCKNKQQCTNCGPNCHCINCNCPKGCPGNCYLGRRLTRKHKGGSGCGPNGCPIAPMSWSQMQKFGGTSFKAGSNLKGGSNMSIPGPFVGQPWTANAWPGQNGVANDNNYLASYKDVVANDPSYHQSMNASGYNKVGGYKKHSVSIKGGGLIPQDLVNLGRGLMYNVNTAYNALNGYKAPVNPLPYIQQ